MMVNLKTIMREGIFDGYRRQFMCANNQRFKARRSKYFSFYNWCAIHNSTPDKPFFVLQPFLQLYLPTQR